jgi:hypothetical protein
MKLFLIVSWRCLCLFSLEMRTTFWLLGTVIFLTTGIRAGHPKACEECATMHCRDSVVVRAIRGSSVFTMPGSSTERKLNVGMNLPEGAQVKTKSRSVVDLVMLQNGVVIRLTPETKLDIEKVRYVSNGKTTVHTHTVLNVPVGKILSSGPRLKSGSTYEVITRRSVKTPGKREVG